MNAEEYQMNEPFGTNQQLIEEIPALRQRIRKLEQSESARRQTEGLLRQEYLFRNEIIANVAEGLCVCHETTGYPFTKFTIWNERMTEITGYTMEEINQRGWYQTVYPDPKVQAEASERMKRMRRSESLHNEEWDILLGRSANFNAFCEVHPPRRHGKGVCVAH
jgi:PAS domain S-box-containing protein